MARTPLAQAVEDAVARVADEELRTTRRGLLLGAGAALVGATALARPARGAAVPKIVVVGAGLGGLTCAYRLRQQGLYADVYEASDRIGGRCWTGRGAFADGQIYERGGELIDNGHLQVKQLAQELGLDLDNLIQAEAAGTEQLGHFFGQPYTVAQMSDDLKTIWQQLHKDTSAASYPTTYHVSTPRGRELDRMSIAQWIDNYVPGGHASRLGQLLDVAYTIEYGADCTVQSSLNMLYLLGYVGPGQFRTFGKSNEKFHVRGGNDQLATRMAAQLASQIQTGTELVAVKRNAGGTFTLSFVRGTGSFQVTADHVVLALPFSIMRASVDWSQAGFGREKALAIDELGMGTNSKLHLQFSSRFWRAQGLNGETYSDRGYQNTWEVSRAQPGKNGILVNYTGGTIGASFGSGTPSSRAKQFLGQVEPVLPGATKAWNGRVTLDFWTAYPWTRGSYSYWKVGQYTRFSGAEYERSGNCHFCGEHTSQDFQGYLNGGVETGERVAADILADLK
ncbi:MAG TPA: NAD(P)/FAD-dependent oxidoreductase [Gaiellaceae bacterium]